MKLISPSLLSADFGNLQRDIEMLNASECDWLHVDVMDGLFVPNISFGQPIVKHIKKHAQKPLDVHLMIMDPGRYVNDFKEAGADILTVHYEACTHLDRTIHAIHDAGMKAGVVLNPSSPVCLLEDIIQECDMVLLMSVNPGFGGQKFIPYALHTLGDIPPERAVMVGDTYFDTRGAVQCGVDFIGVLYGYGTREMMEQSGATVFAADPREILAHIL